MWRIWQPGDRYGDCISRRGKCWKDFTGSIWFRPREAPVIRVEDSIKFVKRYVVNPGKKRSKKQGFRVFYCISASTICLYMLTDIISQLIIRLCSSWKSAGNSISHIILLTKYQGIIYCNMIFSLFLWLSRQDFFFLTFQKLWNMLWKLSMSFPSDKSAIIYCNLLLFNGFWRCRLGENHA